MKKIYILISLIIISLCLYRVASNGFTFYSFSQITAVAMLYLFCIYDIESQLLPMEDLLIFGGMSVLLLFLNANIGILRTVITCVVISCLLLLIGKFTADGIGKGDIIIIACCMLLLGYEQGVLLLIIALILSGITGIFLLVVKGLDRKTRMPFIPFLLIGYVVMLLI